MIPLWIQFQHPFSVSIWHIHLAPVSVFMVLEAIRVSQDTDPTFFMAWLTFWFSGATGYTTFALEPCTLKSWQGKKRYVKPRILVAYIPGIIDPDF